MTWRRDEDSDGLDARLVPSSYELAYDLYVFSVLLWYRTLSYSSSSSCCNRCNHIV